MVVKFQLRLWGGAVSLVLMAPLVLSGCSLSSGSEPLSSQAASSQAATVSAADDATEPPVVSQSGDISPDDVSPDLVEDNSLADNSSVLSAIASSQVIYLAETHNDPADHTAQLEIIQALDADGDIAIGLEMFQRPFQFALDDYLAGNLDEAGLIAASEYETRWGFDWEFYAPILRYAKENNIPLLALNTPAEMTRKVAKTGLESLEGDDLKYIPPVVDIDLSDQDYKDWIASVFNAHGGAGHSLNFDNFFAAQVLWDETMAERVVQQLSEQPDRQVIVLAGEGHVLNGYGIPNRVERRLPEIAQSSVQLVPDAQRAAADAIDFVWVTGGE